MDNSTGSPHGGLLRWLAIILASSCLLACTKANRTQATAADRVPSGVLTGIFRAGNVAGLDFVSETQSGVTDADGQFTCTAGEPIAFSIGNVDFGDTPCVTVVHPAALTASGSLMEPKAINITRLLLMLDHDQVAENGIEISAPLRTLAESWPAIDFEAADFEGQLTAVISDIASAEGRTVRVPSGTEAFVYLDASVACAYSGLFVNTFYGGAFGAPTTVALMVYRGPGSDIDVFEGRIRRDHLPSLLHVLAQGTVDLKTLPTLINGPSVTTGSISGQYRTPDFVGGAWENAIAQQAVDRTGVFDAARVGGTSGDYRFTGAFTSLADPSTRIPRGFATFILDGDTLTGEAFDSALGGGLSVSGRRLPGSNSVEFTVSALQGSATAELITDVNGEPIGLQGPWPGVVGGELDAAGCRLN